MLDSFDLETNRAEIALAVAYTPVVGLHPGQSAQKHLDTATAAFVLAVVVNDAPVASASSTHAAAAGFGHRFYRPSHDIDSEVDCSFVPALAVALLG